MLHRHTPPRSHPLPHPPPAPPPPPAQPPPHPPTWKNSTVLFITQSVTWPLQWVGETGSEGGGQRGFIRVWKVWHVVSLARGEQRPTSVPGRGGADSAKRPLTHNTTHASYCAFSTQPRQCLLLPQLRPGTLVLAWLISQPVRPRCVPLLTPLGSFHTPSPAPCPAAPRRRPTAPSPFPGVHRLLLRNQRLNDVGLLEVGIRLADGGCFGSVRRQPRQIWEFISYKQALYAACDAPRMPRATDDFTCDRLLTSSLENFLNVPAIIAPS